MKFDRRVHRAARIRYHDRLDVRASARGHGRDARWSRVTARFAVGPDRAPGSTFPLEDRPTGVVEAPGARRARTAPHAAPLVPLRRDCRMDQPPSSEPAPAEPPYDCLVISDLHLGSAICQAKLLEQFLEWAVQQSRQLVINGDIFDDLNFTRL